MLDLYTNIRKLRIEKGLSQNELARRTGYTDRSSIAKIEKGEVDLTQSKIKAFAAALNVTPIQLMGWADSNAVQSEKSTAFPIKQIPVYYSVSAGAGCFADQNNIDCYIDIPESMAKDGEYFGLRVRGDSMEPDIKDGDIVIVKKTEEAEDGKTVIAIVNGDDGFCKRLATYAEGLGLVSNNPSYKPMYFSAEEVRSLPVRIIGIVQRLIRDF